MKPEDVSHDPLLRDLNERQLEAVVAEDASKIILAGAGSGKTGVLTRRAAYLIREGRTSEDHIMLVTFTSKAAKEMKSRLERMLGQEGQLGYMWIGTFHGLCNRMLRENYVEAGLPSTFAIMDASDQLSMCKRILRDMPTKPSDVDVSDLVSFINMQKEYGIRPHKVDKTIYDEFSVEFYEAYETQCSREGVVDFAELLLRVTEMLETDGGFRDYFRDKFTHIQVDEFQDTNAIQYRWLRALKGDRATLFAVGDDDQSIYSFRGSDIKNMQDFVAEIGQENVIRLEQNYRSTGAILQAANSLIKQNAGRLGKDLWTDAGSGNRVRVLGFKTDTDEADYVARSIKKLIASGADPEEIAILYRSNYQSRGYEAALIAHAVPYEIHGGIKFYDRTEVKNALAYMRLVANEADDTAFARIVNFPSRGLGEKAVDQFQQKAKSELVATGAAMSLLEAATYVEASPKVVTALDDFIKLLVDLHDGMTSKPLPDYIEFLIDKTGLFKFYEDRKDDKERQRALSLLELVGAAGRFCEECDIPDAVNKPAIEVLPAFLATASLEPAFNKGKVGQEEERMEKPKTIKLMTVHASKGLEFDAVYIGGADDTIFPIKNAVELDDNEEERRLMYVAITRAKIQCSLTTRDSAFVNGKRVDLAPSRFISEIADEYKSCGRPQNARQLAERAAQAEDAGGARGHYPGARDQEMWGGEDGGRGQSSGRRAQPGR